MGMYAEEAILTLENFSEKYIRHGKDAHHCLIIKL